MNGCNQQLDKKGRGNKAGPVLTTMVVVTGGALSCHPREQAMIVFKFYFLTVATRAENNTVQIQQQLATGLCQRTTVECCDRKSSSLC